MKKLQQEIIDLSFKISEKISQGDIYGASNLRLLLNIKIDKLIKHKRKVEAALEKLNARG
jgi:hypothetical protein